MDFSVGDDQYEMYENNNKIKSLYNMKKIILAHMVFIVDMDRKFNVKKCLMSKLWTDSILTEYKYYNHSNFYGNIRDTLVTKYNQNEAKDLIEDDKTFLIVKVILNVNNKYDKISEKELLDIIDKDILMLKIINTEISIRIHSNISNFIDKSNVINVPKAKIPTQEIIYTVESSTKPYTNSNTEPNTEPSKNNLTSSKDYKCNSKELYIKEYNENSALTIQYRNNLLK